MTAKDCASCAHYEYHDHFGHRCTVMTNALNHGGDCPAYKQKPQ